MIGAALLWVISLTCTEVMFGSVLLVTAWKIGSSGLYTASAEPAMLSALDRLEAMVLMRTDCACSAEPAISKIGRLLMAYCPVIAVSMERTLLSTKLSEARYSRAARP
ncbi:hypothetical protein D3C72_1125590 [compost metagenome]